MSRVELLKIVESFSAPFDTGAAKEELRNSEIDDFRVRIVPVREVLSIWQFRAERAHEAEQPAKDMDLLVERAGKGDLDAIAEVFLESEGHGSMFFLEPDRMSLISIIRR